MQRKIAYEILLASFKDGQYANLGLKNRLKDLKPIQRGFVTELVNGILKNYYLLEYQFRNYIKQDTKTELKLLMAMSVYERFYLGKDDYVAVNEYVNLAQSKSEKSLLNAVLRKIDTFKEVEGSSLEDISIKYSLPLWIVKMLNKQYDEEMFNFLINDLKEEPEVYYHLNHHKANYSDLNIDDINRIDDDIFSSSHSLVNEKSFKEGLYYVQDYNSSKIVKMLDLKPESVFLDVCSAPGSKLFNALDVVKGENAYANDLHVHRINLIKSKARQLGFEDIHYLNEDATKGFIEYQNFFDRILLDVPCSGLGVLKRKPDLRYHIKPEDIDDIVKLQEMILDNTAKLLKISGIMVYSTCTINTKENRKQVDKFLSKHPEFILIEDKMLMERKDSDRFYAAKLLKLK